MAQKAAHFVKTRKWKAKNKYIEYVLGHTPQRPTSSNYRIHHLKFPLHGPLSYRPMHGSNHRVKGQIDREIIGASVNFLKIVTELSPY